jgi:hypothetical protein
MIFKFEKYRKVDANILSWLLNRYILLNVNMYSNLKWKYKIVLKNQSLYIRYSKSEYGK